MLKLHRVTLNKRKLRNSAVLIFLLILFFLLKPWVQVGAGERGVIIDFGIVQDNILNEGIHFKKPLIQTINLMDVKIQQEKINVEAYSFDLKEIELSVVVNYHLIPNKVNVVYNTIGVEFNEIIIKPSIQEVTTAVLVKYTAMELITKRLELIQEIEQTLKTHLLPSNILVDSISIQSLNTPKPLTDLNKTKPTAKEIVLTNAEKDLRRIRAEVEKEFPIMLKNRDYRAYKKRNDSSENKVLSH